MSAAQQPIKPVHVKVERVSWSHAAIQAVMTKHPDWLDVDELTSTANHVRYLVKAEIETFLALVEEAFNRMVYGRHPLPGIA